MRRVHYIWRLHIRTLTLTIWFVTMIQYGIKPTKTNNVWSPLVVIIFLGCGGCVVIWGTVLTRGQWWVSSLRNYHISMVIYADPRCVVATGGSHGSLRDHGICRRHTFFCVYFYYIYTLSLLSRQIPHSNISADRWDYVRTNSTEECAHRRNSIVLSVYIVVTLEYTYIPYIELYMYICIY